MGNNSQIQAKGKDSIKLEHGKFKDVLYVPSLAANLLSVYQMNHIGSPEQVIFRPNLVEITYISTGNIIAKGVANHASKVYEFSHFMPFSEPVHSQLPLLQLILPHMVDHTFMAFLVPLQTLDPMDHFCTFDVSKIIPKRHSLFYVRDF